MLDVQPWSALLTCTTQPHQLEDCFVSSKLCTAQPIKRKAATEGEDNSAKKAKATPGANGASGSGSAAPTSEGPKRRGRPTNKEASAVILLHLLSV